MDTECIITQLRRLTSHLLTTHPKSEQVFETTTADLITSTLPSLKHVIEKLATSQLSHNSPNDTFQDSLLHAVIYSANIITCMCEVILNHVSKFPECSVALVDNLNIALNLPMYQLWTKLLRQPHLSTPVSKCTQAILHILNLNIATAITTNSSPTIDPTTLPDLYIYTLHSFILESGPMDNQYVSVWNAACLYASIQFDQLQALHLVIRVLDNLTNQPKVPEDFSTHLWAGMQPLIVAGLSVQNPDTLELRTKVLTTLLNQFNYYLDSVPTSSMLGSYIKYTLNPILECIACGIACMDMVEQMVIKDAFGLSVIRTISKLVLTHLNLNILVLDSASTDHIWARLLKAIKPLMSTSIPYFILTPTLIDLLQIPAHQVPMIKFIWTLAPLLLLPSAELPLIELLFGSPEPNMQLITTFLNTLDGLITMTPALFPCTCCQLSSSAILASAANAWMFSASLQALVAPMCIDYGCELASVWIHTIIASLLSVQHTYTVQLILVAIGSVLGSVGQSVRVQMQASIQSLNKSDEHGLSEVVMNRLNSLLLVI